MKADEIGIELDGAQINEVIDDLKRLEHEGYHFEAADASLELLMRRAAGQVPEFFRVESMRVITDELPGGEFTTEATVKVWVGDGDDAERRVWVAEGNGPVNAIDTALRKAVGTVLPELADIHLTDYKVRILDGASATGSTTRVLLSATDGTRDWTTIGVSPNIIEASWRALEDSLVYGLLHRSLATAEPDGPGWRLIERAAMAVPRFSPVPPTDRPRYYESPDHVPESWTPDRPGEIEGFQPAGPHLGEQGPDQGFALRIAAQLRPKLQMQPGETRRRRDPRAASVSPCAGHRCSRGRRSCTTSRSPSRSGVSTIPRPPAELVELRRHDVRGAAPRRPPLHRGSRRRRHGTRGHAADDAGAGRCGVSGRLAHPRRRLIGSRP